MAEKPMPNGYGAFCWNQLNTPDLEASRAFYEGLFGWRLVQDEVAGVPMHLIQNGTGMLGDFMVMPAEVKAPSHWLSYVWVQDIEAVVAKVEALGGSLCLPITEISQVGRIAVLADPQGATLGVYTSGHAPAEAQPSGAGTFCWYECATRDVEALKTFYGGLFGWSPLPQSMGDFTYTLMQRGDEQIAGIMPMEGPQWDGIPDHWLTYVAVADIEATVARVAGLNGQVCVPVKDIGIGRFAVLMDPLGAVFSVFQAA